MITPQKRKLSEITKDEFSEIATNVYMKICGTKYDLQLNYYRSDFANRVIQSLRSLCNLEKPKKEEFPNLSVHHLPYFVVKKLEEYGFDIT